MSAARGPMNFSTNEECGFLAEGFDLPPSFMMPYTKPCYLEFMEQLGYRPVKDLLAYDYNSGGVEPPYLERFSRRVSERMNVSVRPMQMHRFEEEVTRAFEVYNAAWARNWGFVPMTGGEFRYMARSLRHIIDPALALLAEVDGQPVGFSLGLPDFNLVLKKLGGRLWPFGFLRLLRAKRRIDRARVMVLGVVEKYRRKGVDALLYHTSFRNGLALGYWKCEMSWILEDNAMMNRALVRMGAWVSKRYRIFEKSL